MLQKSHQTDEHNAALRHKQNSVLSENQELKGKVIDLRGKLMDKSMHISHLESKM